MKHLLLPFAKRLLPLAGLLALSLPAASFAQTVPSAMNFQGRLAKTDGTPVPDGAYNVTFSLYNAATGGALLWTKNVTGISVHNGAFATRLDFSSGFQNGATLASAFGGSPVYLDISINGGASLAPRQQFVSNAYAFTANTALNVATGSVTGAGLAAGTITADKFAPNVFNPIAWLLGGNSGTNGTQFLGTTDNQPLVFKVNGHQAMRYSYAENTTDPNNKYRSINVLGGSEINSIATGVVGATIAGGGYNSFTGMDYPNKVTADSGTVGGGYGNTANGYSSTIGGGEYNNTFGGVATVAGGSENYASEDYATIGGGGNNKAISSQATVAGGLTNTASGNYATVGGGGYNVASGIEATIAGGYGNTASGEYAATIAGGVANTASAIEAAIGGGVLNTASGNYATIAGGYQNTAAGQYSFAAGQQAQANHNGSFVWNDSASAVFADTGNNQFLIHATGNVGINTSAPGSTLSVAGTLGVSSSAYISGGLGVGGDLTSSGTIYAFGGDSVTINYGYLNSSGKIGTASGQTNAYSLYASSRIAATEFNAFSDARIKRIAGRSDADADLRTLLGIEVTDYTLRDTIAQGNKPYKKVIAQQVETVYPQAVSKTTGVLPDIYQIASVQNGWVALATTLKAGERVRLITEKGTDIYAVLQANAQGFRVALPGVTKAVRLRAGSQRFSGGRLRRAGHAERIGDAGAASATHPAGSQQRRPAEADGRSQARQR